eukprot:TRINITY_DN64604_c0_g1_i1.p1 TRINITY_DN64604_c0_g1~~TRINITY_DN64604_c0_g1_i1.p1  ORF type:complete len:276 (+),score=64.60 TRINITY_DN64604_c0_g1_i1:94-921(+)
MAMLPPRPPMSLKVPKAMPLLMVDTDCAGIEEPTTFSMATPRGQAGESSRHFIGTPRAGAILSAFLDFDDADVATDALPLDFDEAMAALQLQENEKHAMAEGRNGDDSCRASTALGHEGSTEFGSGDALSDNDDVAGASEEEDDETDSEEEYEDDFEDESSDEEEDEPETALQACDSQRAGDDLASKPQRKRSCSRAGSRAGRRASSRAASRGALEARAPREGLAVPGPRRNASRGASRTRPRGLGADAEARRPPPAPLVGLSGSGASLALPPRP